MPGTVELQHYMVLFLDVLGQRHRLRQLTMPTTPEERTTVFSILRDTFGAVETLRNSFHDFFEKYSGESEWVAQLPAEIRDKMRQARKAVLAYRGFSDSLVIAVPLKTESENCTPMNGVRATLVAACGLPLFMMAFGHPLRGGLDVGVGMQLENGEIYGAALERAYSLESSVAEYPRIAVGRSFLDYLNWVSKQTPETEFGQIAISSARLCMRFVVEDTDGSLMLDFLGDAFREAVGDTVDRSIVRQAYEFVRQECARCRERGDQRLGSRYLRLQEYFQRRIGSWSLWACLD